MDRRFWQSVRTKRRERGSYNAGVRVVRQVAASARDFSTEAYYHPREMKNSPMVDLCSTSSDDSTTEEDLFFHELHGRFGKKVDGAPMNKITNEVVSRIVENRRSSPSVIARLMGLDELPPPKVVSEMKNETGHFLLKKSFSGLGDNYEYSGNQSFHVNRRQHQNLKIVHDHFDSSKEKHINQVVQKEKRNAKPDIDFIKEQFIGAKRVATTEAHKKSKEFRDALDSVDANKDFFMKIVQEPNSLFAKHFHDLKHSKSSSHINHFKILESSAGKSETFYRSVQTKEQTRKKKDITHCCTNTCTTLHSHSTCNHVDSLFPKLLRSQYTKKTATSAHLSPTSIVVLKPSNQKIRSAGINQSFPGYLQNYKLSCRRHKDFHREFLVERGEQHQFYDVKAKGCNTKATNDIASDISKQVKQSIRSYSEEVLTKIDKYNSSSIYLSEPSLSTEAMRSLSEQWKATSPSQSLVGKGSSTLGEMLSLSSKETPNTLGQLISKNKSDKKWVDKEDQLCSCAYPSGISSSDGWKDECDESLLGYEDNPDLSSIFVSLKPENRRLSGCINSIDACYMLKDVLNLERNDLHSSIIERGHSLLRNLKNCDDKPQLFRSCGEENKRPAKEVEMRQNESRNLNNLNNLAEPKPIILQSKMDDLLHLFCNSSNQQSLDSDKSFLTDLKEFWRSAKFNDSSVIALEKEVQEVASVDFPHFPLVESSLYVIRESGALISPKKVTERLSPVSVLEPTSENGKSTSQILERIGAGLQDLQRQLNLLGLETVDSGDEQSKSLIFNDEATRKILKSLKNGDERDFLYLLDVLTVSGIYAASQINFFDACYSPDNPVFPDVFEKLENKHNMANLWSRSERKLFFDHINAILAEVLAPCLDLHPWVKLKRSTSSGHGRLVDESWRLLVRQRKELGQGKPEEKVLETRWLYIDDHVDIIGREIERMVKDDLLNELVSDFVLR